MGEEDKRSKFDKVLAFMGEHPILTFLLASLILNFIAEMTNAIFGTHLPSIKAGL